MRTGALLPAAVLPLHAGRMENQGIRNGNRAMQDKYPKVYAEKLLYMKEGQYSPNHFHWYKTEDIINRGGGNILIRV